MTGYRTIIFNGLMGLFGFIRLFYPEIILPTDADVNAFLNSVDVVWSFIMVIGNLVMRFVTKTPVGQK